MLGARDGEAESVSEASPPPAAPLELDAVPPGPLRDRLAPVIGVRVLLEAARIQLTSQTLAVLDELEKTVVRLVVESPIGLLGGKGSGGRRCVATNANASRSPSCCSSDAGLIRAPALLVDEAVAAGGGAPAGIRSDIDVAIDFSEDADQAVKRILVRLGEVRDANLPGVLADIDTEFLHDYRVALRRTRAVVREMKGGFPGSRYEWIRSELKWMQTAPARPAISMSICRTSRNIAGLRRRRCEPTSIRS